MPKQPCSPRVEYLDEVIRKRRTTKALAELPWPCPERDEEEIKSILEAAGAAPFHKPAAMEHREEELNGIEPWRCYYLDARGCRNLRQYLIDSGDKTKIPQMLSVALYLIQVTWLPDSAPEENENLFHPSIQNMEHIAAASAAIQNMLLAATARDIPSYWSSGGQLRSREIFEKLKIPSREILLGSIFLFPHDLGDAIVKPGSLRNARTPESAWSRLVDLG